MEPEMAGVVAAIKAAKGWPRRRLSHDVVVADLDGDKVLHPLTGVINCSVELTTDWLSRVEYRGQGENRHATTIKTSKQWGTVVQGAEGRMTTIETWQRVGWLRRLWPWHMGFCRHWCQHHVLLPGSGLPLYNVFVMALLVAPDARRWPKGFYVQSVLLACRNADDVDRITKGDAAANHFRDREGLLAYPTVWGWWKRRRALRQRSTPAGLG